MAASSGVLTSTTGFIVQTVLIVIAVIVTGAELDLSTGSDGDGVPGWVVASSSASSWSAARHAALVPELPQEGRTTPWASSSRRRGTTSTASSVNPSKAVQLFGGNLLSQLLYAMVLGAALHAYGVSLPMLQLVLINCAGLLHRRGGARAGRAWA